MNLSYQEVMNRGNQLLTDYFSPGPAHDEACQREGLGYLLQDVREAKQLTPEMMNSSWQSPAWSYLEMGIFTVEEMWQNAQLIESSYGVSLLSYGSKQNWSTLMLDIGKWQ